jgi:hypothetical protein
MAVTMSDILPNTLSNLHQGPLPAPWVDVSAAGPSDTPVETSVREALTSYPALTGMQAPLAAMAVRLARAYDGYVGGDLTKLARLNQELRQTLQVIAEVGVDDDSDPTGGLPAPLRDATD